MTASERRQAIIEVLCVRRHDTSENLASEFGVTKRTILNDVIALSLSYPIYTTQGNGGGIHVEEGYRSDRKYLSDEEAELLETVLTHLSSKQTFLQARLLLHIQILSAVFFR